MIPNIQQEQEELLPSGHAIPRVCRFYDNYSIVQTKSTLKCRTYIYECSPISIYLYVTSLKIVSDDSKLVNMYNVLVFVLRFRCIIYYAIKCSVRKSLEISKMAKHLLTLCICDTDWLVYRRGDEFMHFSQHRIQTDIKMCNSTMI